MFSKELKDSLNYPHSHASTSFMLHIQIVVSSLFHVFSFIKLWLCVSADQWVSG